MICILIKILLSQVSKTDEIIINTKKQHKFRSLVNRLSASKIVLCRAQLNIKIRLLPRSLFGWLGLQVNTQQGLFKFNFGFCRN